MQWNNLRKAVRHPSFGRWISGGIVLFAIYLPVTLNHESPPGAVPWVLALLVPYYSLSVGFLNYHLCAGSWSVGRWLRGLQLSALPLVAAAAFLAAAFPKLAFVPFMVFLGGLNMFVGFAHRRFFIFVGVLQVILHHAFLILLHSPTIWQGPAPAILGLSFLAACFWIGSASAYLLKLRGQATGDLRATRRDRRIIAEERANSDRLLRNILPEQVAEELKRTNAVKPVRFESASVLFTDFEGFTRIAERLPPEELVAELDLCFSYFDAVVGRNNLEKLKTIGDAFMCAGGIPMPNRTHAVDCVLAAMEIQAIMHQMKELKVSQGLPYWELRVGIHSGPLVAGVIGEKKFSYDVWGDTVNTASRAESAGEVGRINITATTYSLVRDFFDCEFRGRVAIKNRESIDMYFVRRIRPELSRDDLGHTPNEDFQTRYATLQSPGAA